MAGAHWWNRRRRGWVVLGLVSLAAGAVAGLLVWWWLGGVQVVWRDWERASWVAAVVAAGFAVGGTVVRRAGWAQRRLAERRWSRWPGRVRVVGRVPPPAEWHQPRQVAAELVKVLAGGRSVVLTQVLSGMGGVGKTQLAAWLARDLVRRGRVDLVVWVNATEVAEILDGYAEAAAALELAGDGHDAPKAAKRLLAWLESTDRRWLVVLDDLTRPADLAGWWPPASPGGRVVVTTRRRDAVLHGQGRTVVDVDLFSEAEARAYLVQVLPGEPRAELDRLAAELGRLPLALAAAYMRDHELSCQRYLQRWEDRRHRLRDLVPERDALPDEQRETVAATFTLSVEAADQLQPQGLAQPVLRLASVLDPNGIPAALFTAAPVLAHLTGVTGAAVSAEQASDTLRNLHRLNLLTIDTDQTNVRVHALTQRAVRDTSPQQQLASIAEAVAAALLNLWPDLEPDTTAAASLRANTTALYAQARDTLLTSAEVNTVLFRAGNSLGDTGQVAAARDHYQRLLNDVRRVLGADHPDISTIRNNIAYSRGRAEHA